MKGVKVERVHDMYLLEFDSYTVMIGYINMQRPSQMSIAFDGEKLTGSIPIQAYKVRPQNEKKES